MSMFLRVILQSGQDWRGLDSLLHRRSGTVLPLLAVSISGPVFSHFLLFVDGVTLSRYLSAKGSPVKILFPFPVFEHVMHIHIGHMFIHFIYISIHVNKPIQHT